MTTTPQTIVRTAPPRRAEVRGRAIGVSVLAFFGLAWTGWGTGGHLPNTAEIPLMAAVAVTAMLLSRYAWLRVRRLPDDPTTEPGSRDDPAIRRRFNLIVAAEWVVVFAVAGVLGATGHPAPIPAAVCTGVGIHFIPLGRLFHLPAYYRTGVALLLIAVVTFAVASHVRALWTLLPGIGAAVVLFATCAVIIRQINRMT